MGKSHPFSYKKTLGKVGTKKMAFSLTFLARLWKIASTEKDVIDREKESHLPREKEYWVRAARSSIFPYPR